MKTCEMKDTFSSSDNCAKQYQNAHSIHIIADNELVGYVYGPHEPICDEKYTYTYRIGGMNCSATSKDDAINKLIGALNKKQIDFFSKPC